VTAALKRFLVENRIFPVAEVSAAAPNPRSTVWEHGPVASAKSPPSRRLALRKTGKPY